MGSWFSSLHLRTSIECAYCVAIMLINLNVSASNFHDWKF